MTAIDRPVRRKVFTAAGQPLIVTLTPEGIYFREFKRRTSYLLPFGAGYVKAAHLEADRARREKAAERVARGGKATKRVKRGFV